MKEEQRVKHAQDLLSRVCGEEKSGTDEEARELGKICEEESDNFLEKVGKPFGLDHFGVLERVHACQPVSALNTYDELWGPEGMLPVL